MIETGVAGKNHVVKSHTFNVRKPREEKMNDFRRDVDLDPVPEITHANTLHVKRDEED